MQPIKTYPSITALAVIGAFARGLDTCYGKWFNKMDFSLAKHIYNHAIKSDTHILRRTAIKFFNCLPYSIQSNFFDRLVSPEYDAHMVGRKRLVRDTIEQAIKDGAQHIIILGGGYDPRALLAAQQHPNIKFYELDRGETRHIKLNALQNLPTHLNFEVDITELNCTAVKLNHNLLYIECDLVTDNLIKTLTLYGYQPSEKTLIIAEGLTMYLTHANIQQLLADFNQFFTYDSQFLISFLTSAPKTDSFHSIAVHSTDEEYKAVLMPQDVISFVSKVGLHVTAKMLFETMHSAMSNNKTIEAHKSKGSIQENYFILQKNNDETQIKNIEDVSNITLDLNLK